MEGYRTGPGDRHAGVGNYLTLGEGTGWECPPPGSRKWVSGQRLQHTAPRPPVDRRERKQEGTAVWELAEVVGSRREVSLECSHFLGEISSPTESEDGEAALESERGCETGSEGTGSGWSGAIRVRAHELRKRRQRFGVFLRPCRTKAGRHLDCAGDGSAVLGAPGPRSG